MQSIERTFRDAMDDSAYRARVRPESAAGRASCLVVVDDDHDDDDDDDMGT
jgi:hypothetical protein